MEKSVLVFTTYLLRTRCFASCLSQRPHPRMKKNCAPKIDFKCDVACHTFSNVLEPQCYLLRQNSSAFDPGSNSAGNFSYVIASHCFLGPNRRIFLFRQGFRVPRSQTVFHRWMPPMGTLRKRRGFGVVECHATYDGRGLGTVQHTQQIWR